jgi:hypothetical protein
LAELTLLGMISAGHRRLGSGEKNSRLSLPIYLYAVAMKSCNVEVIPVANNEVLPYLLCKIGQIAST